MIPLPGNGLPANREKGRVISGIIFVIRNGLRWRDLPSSYGPHKTIYNRFIRWSELGVFGRIFVELARGGGETEELMIDATHLKAHRTAPVRPCSRGSSRWRWHCAGCCRNSDSRLAPGRFEQRIRELAAGNPMLEAATQPMLSARSALRRELAGLERHVRQLAQEDPVCRRLMSMPGIGAVVALTYRSAVDDPDRFTSSKKVGPWVGLTPSRDQSGERDISGGITKAGDVNLRRALCQAATVMMHRGRASWLRTWAAKLARRRGPKREMVALARRIAVILHRMWKDDTNFRLDIPVLHAG